MDAGLIGGIIGGVVGVAGGAFGTWNSIRKTDGPLERKFMIKASIATWIAVIVFIVLLLLLPRPYNFLMWIPYGIFLPLGIMKINKGLAEIRATERES